jgi:cytochrome P450
MLRMDPPATPGRAVVNPVTLGGVQLQAGEVVLAMVSAADRDPEQFDEPDRLIIGREPNRHLAFSAGPHRCVGSHLARVELGIAIAEIHRRLPDYRLVPQRPPVLHHGQVRGLYELPIEFTPSVNRSTTIAGPQGTG